ncbi:MAG: flotillin-like protein FloA [Meiothermus sp.]|uniref:flotillin-like protein FloA n=1 Tax=Meiothermus sp. TaxID=1955249 RepID=UPI0028CFC382|nr:flotillin-like protein FloA [Meiothermus sp.]MDT7919096.1 flotillin-like protein FloA [Meiothermus sp.]
MEFGALIIAGIALLAVFLFFYLVPVPLWITALFSGVNVALTSLIGMRFRRILPAKIVNPMIKAFKAGIPVETAKLEAQYLAGGNVDRVVDALIAADKAGIKLNFDRAAAIDLAGRDVLEAVRLSVNPKVITSPMVAGMAKDGIQLLATARITVRANIDRLVGGAGEETIVARVGEGIVASIGQSEDHKQVLEQPDRISKTVLAKGLDAGTAFEILSVDIAEVDVGKNIGAQLRTDQAEADKKIAQAKAEERRAMAVAVEQENAALVEAMRAKLVEAQAAVPMALAEALRSGRIGVMDYYQLKNIEADTDMRESISKASGGGTTDGGAGGSQR